MKVAVHPPIGAPFRIAPNTVSFSSQNWGTPQHVAITAFTELPSPANYTATIIHIPTGGGFNTAEADSVDVTVNYLADPRVSAYPMELFITEGHSAQYNLYLNRKPSSPVTVTINTPTDGSITASPAQIAFTVPRWNIPIPITVTTLADDDFVTPPPITITHQPAGGGYNRAGADTVTITTIESVKPEPPKIPETKELENPIIPPDRKPLRQAPPPTPAPTALESSPTLPIVSIYPYPNGKNVDVVEGDLFGVTTLIHTTQPQWLTEVRISIQVHGDMTIVPNIEEIPRLYRPRHPGKIVPVPNSRRQ